jgi:hypothetical protein
MSCMDSEAQRGPLPLRDCSHFWKKLRNGFYVLHLENHRAGSCLDPQHQCIQVPAGHGRHDRTPDSLCQGMCIVPCGGQQPSEGRMERRMQAWLLRHRGQVVENPLQEGELTGESDPQFCTLWVFASHKFNNSI